jgi:hypothetical protein
VDQSTLVDLLQVVETSKTDPCSRSVKASKYPRSSAAHRNEVSFSTKTLKDYYWPPINTDERGFQTQDWIAQLFRGTQHQREFTGKGPLK